MTAEALKELCESIAKTQRELVETSSFKPLFYFGRRGQLFVLRHDLLGPMLNFPQSKDNLFTFTRHLIDVRGYDIFILVSDVWELRGNQRVYELSQAERYSMGTKELVERGYGVRYEAIVVLGQTREHAYKVSMRYERGKRGAKVTATESFPVTMIDGRLMWGQSWNTTKLRQIRSMDPDLLFLALGIDLTTALKPLPS